MINLSHKSSGQAMVEYVIILPALLLIILGSFQIALIYQAKVTLNYATFLAARQGSMHNGKLCIGAAPICSGGGMKYGLAYGMSPLYTRKKTSAGLSDTTIALLSAATAIQLDETINHRQVISTLNPTPQWARSASTSDPYKVITVPSVPNDNLMYRRQSYGGGPGGRAMSIQDGNVLKIRVTYCYKMEIPFANTIIYGINNALLPESPNPHPINDWTKLESTNPNPKNQCFGLNVMHLNDNEKYIPITSDATIRMQSRYIGP